MKRLQEIKDEYAQSLDGGIFKDWKHYRELNEISEDDLDAILEEYGYECSDEHKKVQDRNIKASLSKAANNSRMIFSEWLGGNEKWSMTEYKDIYVINDGHNIILDKQSITSPDNIVLL